MEFVEPIRDKKKIAQIKNLLRGQRRYRDLLLFTIGVNTALRVSDLITLQVKDLLDTDGNPRDYFFTREKKTEKGRRVNINTSIREALQDYRAAYPEVELDPYHYWFFDTRFNDYTNHIERGMVWVFAKNICRDASISGNYGTHTFRKTWGYQARMMGVELSLIMEMFNHSSITETKKYLGITDDELADVVNRLNL